MDTFARVPAPVLLEIHMDPPEPTPAVSAHAMLSELPEEAIAALLGEVGPGADTSLLFAELRHLGGAVARPAVGGGAASHLVDPYAMYSVAIAATPELAERGQREAHRLAETLAPWSSGAAYLNFAEEPVDARIGFPDGAWERLRAVRAEVDPTGRFVSNHPVELPS